MTDQDFYTTIAKSGKAEFKDRGSKFIGYVHPIASAEEFRDRLNEVKKEHAKATHHCFAYRLGLDGNTWRVSDDGEPSGSAGRPILGQIDGKGLVNTLVVVVRYFGGTLLGVPGLINAHYHSHDTLCRGLFEELPLEFWLLYTLPMGQNRSKEEVRARTLVGALESLRCGITTVQDMLGLTPLNEAYSDVVLDAYRESGLRVVFSPMHQNRARKSTACVVIL